MKIEVDFSELGTLRARMGANLSSWSPEGNRLSPIEVIRKELEEGKEIPISEIERAHGGLLTYKGEQVVLYIKDTHQDRDTLLYDQENARKFHIAECRTLDHMRHDGRFERYVATTNTSGVFKVEATEKFTRSTEELEVPLYVCKNCLTALDWKQYTSQGRQKKQGLRDNFSLDDFFAEFSTFFRNKPRHTDETAPKGGYATDWSRISERIRNERGWRCDKCRVNLSEHRGLLHCHHKDGVVSNNSSDNLAALCIMCHSDEPLHNRLKAKPKDRMLIEKLRREQKFVD